MEGCVRNILNTVLVWLFLNLNMEIVVPVPYGPKMSPLWIILDEYIHIQKYLDSNNRPYIFRYSFDGFKLPRIYSDNHSITKKYSAIEYLQCPIVLHPDHKEEYSFLNLIRLKYLRPFKFFQMLFFSYKVTW